MTSTKQEISYTADQVGPDDWLIALPDEGATYGVHITRKSDTCGAIYICPCGQALNPEHSGGGNDRVCAWMPELDDMAKACRHIKTVMEVESGEFHEITAESPALYSAYDYQLELVIRGKDGIVCWFPTVSEPITSVNYKAVCETTIRKLIAEKVLLPTDKIFMNGLPRGSKLNREDIEEWQRAQGNA
jgi:hypothetical protein